VDVRRGIEIGAPAAAVATVLAVGGWIAIGAAVGGECRSYESTPTSVRIFESVLLFAAATAAIGALVNIVALADPRRRTRAWRGLVASLGAAVGLVLAVFIALALTVSACAN
jgi:hypothetical protein